MTSEEVEGVGSDPWQAGGGPAVPVEREHGFGSLVKYRGMSLRDYFAGQVLVGAAGGWIRGDAEMAELARRAYAVADAMIAERCK